MPTQVLAGKQANLFLLYLAIGWEGRGMGLFGGLGGLGGLGLSGRPPGRCT